MNKKTFSLAALFLIATLVWFGVNIYWLFTSCGSFFDLFVALVLLGAGFAMVYNEAQKKKSKHLAEVNKHKIP